MRQLQRRNILQGIFTGAEGGFAETKLLASVNRNRWWMNEKASSSSH
jgi:hypothetical protein